MTSLIVGLLAVVANPFDADFNAAQADYQAHSTEDKAFIRYLTLSAVPEAQRVPWSRVMSFAVSSASRGVVLDRQIPRRVGNSWAYRIDLRDLKWDWRDLNRVMERYPYDYNDPRYPLLMFRGDWLVHELADTTESQAYYLLLYGEPSIPKNEAEFLKFWGADLKAQQDLGFGWIETNSQVARNLTRHIEHLQSSRTANFWFTRDVLKVTKKKDALEALDGKFAFDGTEIIVGTPKYSYRFGKRGTAQIYGLFNGQGGAVNEAPVRLVEDFKRTLNQTAIINNASCVACHDKGMQLPNEVGLRTRIGAGVELYAKSKDKQEFVERFHLTGVDKELIRNIEDYQAYVACVNGLTTEVNASWYRDAINAYASDLSLDKAAGELYCESKDLRLALGYAAANKIDLGNRAAGLAYGFKIPRATFNDSYKELVTVVKIWKGKRR